MSKSDLEFKLVDISSSYDPESDYFTLQANMKPSSFENLFILYSKILCYQNNILINASDNTLMLFENKDDVCFIHDGIFENGNNNPHKFEVIYGVFDLIEKNKLNLKLSGPPELSRKGGSFIVHQPETNFIGSNKWKFGSISIKSIVIKKLEGSFEISFNLENKNFLTSIPIIEIKGKNWEQKTQPILADNSKFQITIDIYEEIDSSDLEFNFMFFEAVKSERLSDQIVPTPEIEESNNNDEEEITEDSQLGLVIENFMDECQEDLFVLEEPFRDHVLSKFTPEAPKISLGFGLYPIDSNTFGISVNMFLNDYDTDDPISYKDIEILNPENVPDENKVDVFFERVQDAIYDDFCNVAEHGFKGLKLPKDIADAFVHSSKAKYEYVETKIYWNDDEIDSKVDMLEEDDEYDQNEEDTPNPTNANEDEDKISSIDTNSFFKHNVMLVSIGKSLTENKKIYEAARYAWDAKKERAEKMDYVIAHQSGKIVGVFEPEKWLYADDKEFSDFPEADPKRIGFIGKVADSEILLEYLNKDIPSEYRPKGASNPVRYIELEKSNTKTENKNKKSKVSPKKVKKSDVKEFGWWNIHKGYDENDIDQYICEFYEIKDDLDENGEEIFDEDGYSSTQKDDGWGNLYNPKITMEMVMSIETFLQKYIDEYDGDFGETDMGRALKEWIVKYTSHVQHDPPWDYPDRNYKMWD